MDKGVRNTILACLAFMALMLALFLNNVLRGALPTDEELATHGIMVLPAPREMSEFALIRDDGQAFTRADLAGGWTFAYFGFTHCPDICPVAMSVMSQARADLMETSEGERFRGLLVSVDPQRDTPEVLADYVEYFDPEFRGVTGTREALAGVAAQVSVAFAAIPAPDQEDGYTVDHTGNIVVFNPRGHYHGYIRMPHTAEQVVLAYRTLSARM